MNFDDEQELLILSKIYKIDRANQIEDEKFKKIFEETIGVGWEIIFNRLLRAGITEGRNNYFTTESGIRKFAKLKKDKRRERIIYRVMWGTIFIAASSLIYGVLNYYGCGKTNSRSSQKLESGQQQPSKAPTPTLKPDTTKVQDTLSINADSGHRKHL